MKAWSEIRIRRLAMMLLFAAGLLIAVAAVSVDPAVARTRTGSQQGDPDSPDSPGPGPKMLARTISTGFDSFGAERSEGVSVPRANRHYQGAIAQAAQMYYLIRRFLWR